MPSGSSTSSANSRTPAATLKISWGGSGWRRARLTACTSSSNVPADTSAQGPDGHGRESPSPGRHVQVPACSAIFCAPSATCRPNEPLPCPSHSSRPVPSTTSRMNRSAYRLAGVSSDTAWPGQAACTSSPDPPWFHTSHPAPAAIFPAARASWVEYGPSSTSHPVATFGNKACSTPGSLRSSSMTSSASPSSAAHAFRARAACAPNRAYRPDSDRHAPTRSGPLAASRPPIAIHTHLGGTRAGLPAPCQHLQPYITSVGHRLQHPDDGDTLELQRSRLRRCEHPTDQVIGQVSDPAAHRPTWSSITATTPDPDPAVLRDGRSLHQIGQVVAVAQATGSPYAGPMLGLPAVPVRELLDRLTIRGLEILPARICHCDQRSLLHLGVIDAQDRRHLFLELEVDLRPG